MAKNASTKGPKRPRVTAGEKSRIYKLSDEGVTRTEIAKKVKRPKSTVDRILRVREQEKSRKAGKPFRRLQKVGSRRAGTQGQTDDVQDAVDRLVAAIRKTEQASLLDILSQQFRT